MPRSLPAIEGHAHYTPYGNGGIYLGCDYDFSALVASEGHWRLPNGRWSSGGPLYVIKESLSHTKQDIDWTYYNSVWNGLVLGAGNLAVGYYPSWASVKASRPTFAQQQASSQAGYATGWARTRPGNPTANLGQFLIELRDLPQVPFTSLLKGRPFRSVGYAARQRMGFFQSLGSEYLNVVFGWKPFVKDLQDIYYLTKNIDKQIAQIKRDNGRAVTRRSTIRNDTVTDQTVTQYGFPLANVGGTPPNWATGQSTYSVTTSTTIKQWYTAAYIYYIADVTDWKWNTRARAALFGVNPTPALLWEVLPWSWLVDWFVNVGDVMSNASQNAVDNLVATYSYIMTHTTTTTTQQSDSSWGGKYLDLPSLKVKIDPGSASVGSTLKKETKVRCSGSPYGLGVSYSGLSAGQKGVLAALGMSRSRF